MNERDMMEQAAAPEVEEMPAERTEGEQELDLEAAEVDLGNDMMLRREAGSSNGDFEIVMKGADNKPQVFKMGFDVRKFLKRAMSLEPKHRGNTDIRNFLIAFIFHEAEQKTEDQQEGEQKPNVFSDLKAALIASKFNNHGGELERERILRSVYGNDSKKPVFSETNWDYFKNHVGFKENGIA